MPMPFSVEKATFKNVDTSKKVTVQFNPETLSVQYMVMNPHGNIRPCRQPIHGSVLRRSINFTLLFDVTLNPDGPSDVQTVTKDLIDFFRPAETTAALPTLEFQWGTFIMAGTVQSFDETLEYFSPDGTPLRARMTISMLETTDRKVVTPTLVASKTQLAQFAAVAAASVLVGAVSVATARARRQ